MKGCSNRFSPPDGWKKWKRGEAKRHFCYKVEAKQQKWVRRPPGIGRRKKGRLARGESKLKKSRNYLEGRGDK